MVSSGVHPLVASVRDFVEREVRPAAADLEHADRYPHELVARMRELGLFGAVIPAAWGGLGLDVTTYARLVEELCRGWMSLAGVINSHTMAALIVLHHGTDVQREQFLPRLARGEARGGLCVTEPHAGSDVQAIRTRAVRRGDEYVVNGTKMFVTNGREGTTFALLAVTSPAATPRHHGMSCFIVEKGHPGLRVAKSVAKLGYKGVDTAELVLEDVVVPAANLVGGVEGRGFKHVMSGLEAGRLNIAARAVGVGQAALEAALARVGEAPPALAGMAARLQSARLLTYWAAGLKDRKERCDLEAGMALGGRGLDPARLVLDGVSVVKASTLEARLDEGRLRGLAQLGLAATALGLAQAAFEAGLRYSQQRSAFGQPICHHQAIQLKLADMATSLVAARLLTYHAAECLESGDDLPAGLARLLATETASAVALESMRIHGGYGYTAEFPVERYYRDAPRLLLALGGPDAERARLARRLPR